MSGLHIYTLTIFCMFIKEKMEDEDGSDDSLPNRRVAQLHLAEVWTSSSFRDPAARLKIS